MKVSFTPQARNDLAAIHAWIAENDAHAAHRVVTRIVRAAAVFGRFPLLGHEGRVPGTREFVVVRLPYRIVYRVAPESGVDVLTMVHVRRRWPVE